MPTSATGTAIGTGGIGSGKTPIAGAVSRKGDVVARVIESVSRSVVTDFIRQSVSEKVVTDHAVVYDHLGEFFPHEVINHRMGHYVVGAIHTNTIEGFWSIFNVPSLVPDEASKVPSRRESQR